MLGTPGFFDSAAFKEFEGAGFESLLTVSEAAEALGIRKATLCQRARLDPSYLSPQLRSRPTAGRKNGSLFGVSKAAVEAELAEHGKGYLRPPFGKFWSGELPARCRAGAGAEDGGDQ